MKEKFELPVKHVSHTAWLVAAYRAQESQRSDAHFNDRLAVKLLGGLEREYLAGFTNDVRSEHWLLTVRTCLIDDLILKAIRSGVKTILNLGAGLDTRPYRLNIPSSISWFEADYPDLITYKNEKLIGEKPNCQLVRIPADLSKKVERQSVLNIIDKQSGPTLVLTEGLLGYLPEKAVAELAQELYAMSSRKYWLMDIFNKSFIDSQKKFWQPIVKDSKDHVVKLDFIPENTATFLSSFGWKLDKFFSFGKEACRLERFPRGMDRQTVLEDPGFSDSGVALFD